MVKFIRFLVFISSMPYTTLDKNLVFQDGFHIEVGQIVQTGRGYVGIGREQKDNAIFFDPSFYFPDTVFTLYDKNEGYIGCENIPRKWPRSLKRLVKSTGKGRFSLGILLKDPLVREYLDERFKEREQTSH